jgi:hypothetical protein
MHQLIITKKMGNEGSSQNKNMLVGSLQSVFLNKDNLAKDNRTKQVYGVSLKKIMRPSNTCFSGGSSHVLCG